MEDNNNIFVDDSEEEKIKFNKVKIISNAITIALGIVISVLILVALYVVIKPSLGIGFKSQVFNQEELEKIEEAARIIDSDYLYDYDRDKLIDGAINGMVESLGNIFTYYENEEEYQETQNSGSNDKYIGIGVHLVYDSEHKAIKVLGTMPDSPAENAGIKPGDIILRVDNINLSLETYLDAVNALKGEEHTNVNLRILRKGEEFDVAVERLSITENNVYSEIIDNIGYIKIYSFSNGIYDQFRAEYDKLRAKNVKGIVVDLRNNSGGIVYDTLRILNIFLPKCDALKLVDKSGKTQVIQTDNNEQIDIPLTVLVNENSASASEIFASAVKDSGKGIIIGTKTFGKGVVQYVREIDGHGAISIVAAQYFTPSGVVIQDNGIEPNIVVELPEDLKNETWIDQEQDLQLQKALEVINEQL